MKAKFAAACMLAALAQAPHATAGTATVTYFGVVANTQTILGATEPAPDYDLAQLFGGGNLEGDFITATFVYDTSLGVETTTARTSDELDGGFLDGASSPIVSATYVIQQPGTGTTYSYTFTPDVRATAYTDATGLFEAAYSSAGDESYVYFKGSASTPTSLGQSFTMSGFGPGSYLDPSATNVPGAVDAIVFDTLQVTVDAAPEPRSWALLIAGVAMVGTALRLRARRRASTITAI